MTLISPKARSNKSPYAGLGLSWSKGHFLYCPFLGRFDRISDPLYEEILFLGPPPIWQRNWPICHRADRFLKTNCQICVPNELISVGLSGSPSTLSGHSSFLNERNERLMKSFFSCTVFAGLFYCLTHLDNASCSPHLGCDFDKSWKLSKILQA